MTSKPVRWSPHALDALNDRKINRLEVLRAVAAPEFVVPDPPGRDVYMRRYFDALLGQEVLLRVVVEEAETELVVVTAYKTSQLRQYLKGLVP